MKDFLLKMYRAYPYLDDRPTAYGLFVISCTLINLGLAFFLVLIYIFEGFIFWRVIHTLALLSIIQLAVIAAVAYLKEGK